MKTTEIKQISGGGAQHTAGRDHCFELHDGLQSSYDFTCAICLEDFSKPKTLPCGHSFCAGCLQQLLLQKPDQVMVACPKCKSEHHKQNLCHLTINTTLQSAVATTVGVCYASKPAYPVELRLLHSITCGGRFLSEQIYHVTLAAKGRRVCFTTQDSVLCYDLLPGMRQKFLWKKDMLEVTSLTATSCHVLLAQRKDKLTYISGSGYTCWVIYVIDIETGEEIRQLHGGLGQECSATLLPCGRIALADTGDYTHHAQPCVILMNDEGKERQVLTTPNRIDRLIKPTAIIGSPNENRIIVYDAGDKHVKCYFTTTTTGLLLNWKVKVKNFIAMTTDSNKPVSQYDNGTFYHETNSDKYFTILTQNGLEIMDFNGGSVHSIEYKWRGVARDVSISDCTIAVSEGKELQVYSSDTDGVIGSDNHNYVV